MFPLADAENRAWKTSLVAKVSIVCSEAICFYLVDEYTIDLGWQICHSWKLTTFVVVAVVVISVATLIILWVMTYLGNFDVIQNERHLGSYRKFILTLF